MTLSSGSRSPGQRIMMVAALLLCVSGSEVLLPTDHDDTTSDKFDGLLEWVQGAVNTKPQLRVNARRSHLRYTDILKIKNGRYGLGLVSEQRFERGDTVAQLPLAGLITEFNYRGSSGSGRWSDDLAFFLIQQRRAGAASPWAPYLDMLPRYGGRSGIESNRPKFWEPGIFQRYLRGSHFADFVANRAASVRADYARLNTDKVSWNEYEWARDIIATRAMNPPGSAFQLPLLFSVFDLALHGDVENIHIVMKGEYLCAVAVRQILPGDEFLNTYVSYGISTSWIAAEAYGFTTPKISNRRKQVQLQVSAVNAKKHAMAISPAIWQHRDTKTVVMQELNFTLLNTLQHGRGAPAFLSYLRFLATPDRQVFDWKFSNTLAPVSQEKWAVEAAAFKIGLQLVTEALEQYPDSLEVDRQLLEGDVLLTSRSMFLVSIRYDEKLTLQWWQQIFQRGLRQAVENSVSVAEYWAPRALTQISMAEADTGEQLAIVRNEIHRHVHREYECGMEMPLEFALGLWLSCVVFDLAFRGLNFETVLITTSPTDSVRAMLAKRAWQVFPLLLLCAILKTHAGSIFYTTEEWRHIDMEDWRPFGTKLRVVATSCACVLGLGAFVLNSLVRGLFALFGVADSPRPLSPETQMQPRKHHAGAAHKKAA